MIINEWISISFDQEGIEHYKDLGIGFRIYIHKHGINKSFPWHFHIYLGLIFWYLELQIGHDIDGESLLKESEKE